MFSVWRCTFMVNKRITMTEIFPYLCPCHSLVLCRYSFACLVKLSWEISSRPIVMVRFSLHLDLDNILSKMGAGLWGLDTNMKAKELCFPTIPTQNIWWKDLFLIYVFTLHYTRDVRNHFTSVSLVQIFLVFMRFFFHAWKSACRAICCIQLTFTI